MLMIAMLLLSNKNRYLMYIYRRFNQVIKKHRY